MQCGASVRQAMPQPCLLPAPIIITLCCTSMNTTPGDVVLAKKPDLGIEREREGAKCVVTWVRVQLACVHSANGADTREGQLQCYCTTSGGTKSGYLLVWHRTAGSVPCALLVRCKLRY